MKPRTPLKRSAIKRKHRKPSETLRVYGPKGYVEWIHEQPCIVCGYTPSECAHTKNGGTGRKADFRFTVPLCGAHPIAVNHRIENPFFPGHHQVLHAVGRETFEKVYGVELSTEASRVEKMWRELQDQEQSK